MRNILFFNAKLIIQIKIFLILINSIISNNIDDTYSTNLTLLLGESVQLNCTYKLQVEDFGISIDSHSNEVLFNPTWLKADVKYDENSKDIGFKTENILVTRKGIIVDAYKGKIGLETINSKTQSLRINSISAKDEGKYICRQFNSKYDQLYYLKVNVPINGLAMKFFSTSQYFRSSLNNNNMNRNSYDIIDAESVSTMNTITIRENDEVTVNCTVNSSKPAAQISIWLSSVMQENEVNKLDIAGYYVTRNKDNTMKSVAVASFKATKYDSKKSIICLAENLPLEEKWKTKRTLNILFPPTCAENQRFTYHTGINQTVEIECHMTESNPIYLDFSWYFPNNKDIKERSASNGHISKIKWTPHNEFDFGNIICAASNSLDSGQCIIKLELGGPPNPPEDCHYKENNTTTIIECKPGFHQGDPEVYFYLLNKNQSGVLIEYSRKRDSCSFLISNLILREYENEFYIYSSNKYGDNKEKSAKLIIYNEKILLDSKKALSQISQDTKQIVLIIVFICGLIAFLTLCCCICTKCKSNSSMHKRGNLDDYDAYLPKSRIMDNSESSNMLKVPLNNDENYDNEKLYSSIRSKDKFQTFQRKDEIEFLDMSPTSTKRKIKFEMDQTNKYFKNIDYREAPYIDDSIYGNTKHQRKSENYSDSNFDLGYNNFYTFNLNATNDKVRKENLWYLNSGNEDENEFRDSLNMHKNSIKYEDNYPKKHIDDNTGLDLLTNPANFGILV